MGIIQHDCIIGITCNSKEFLRIRDWVQTSVPEKFRRLFLFGGVVVNNYQTVVMIPDGSKDGWPESDEGDKIRQMFIDEMLKTELTWEIVSVGFGDLGLSITCKSETEEDDN